MSTQPETPIRQARSRHDEDVIGLALQFPENNPLDLVNLKAARIFARALNREVAARNLLRRPGTHSATCGLGDSTYLFFVTNRMAALEAIQAELIESRIPDAYFALGYWCEDECIFRTWYPLPAQVDLNAALMGRDWDAEQAEVEALIKQIRARIDAGRKQ